MFSTLCIGCFIKLVLNSDLYLVRILVTFCQNSFVITVLVKPNYIPMDTFYSNSLFYMYKTTDTGTACILVSGIDRMSFFSCIEMMKIWVQLCC